MTDLNADIFVPGTVIPATVTNADAGTWHGFIKSREMIPLGFAIIRMRGEDPPRYRNALVLYTAGRLHGDQEGITCAARFRWREDDEEPPRSSGSPRGDLSHDDQ